MERLDAVTPPEQIAEIVRALNGVSWFFPQTGFGLWLRRSRMDFRKGHDGLAALVQNEPHKEPFTGTVFVFRSKNADRLKLLY